MTKKRQWLSLALASGVSFGCSGPVSDPEDVDQIREALNICNETVAATRAVDGIPAYAQCTASQSSAIYSNNGIDTSTVNEGTGWVRTQSSGGYQCTELAGRYLVFHWGVTWRPTGNAGTWCDTVPPSTSGVVQTSVPVHGDIIVFPPGSCGASATTGHVAVVDTVDTAASRVTFVEQNSPSRRTDDFSCAACFLHVVANTGEGGSGGASGTGGAVSSTGGSAPGAGGTRPTGGVGTNTGGAAAAVGGSQSTTGGVQPATGGATSASGGTATAGGSASLTGGTGLTTGGTSSGGGKAGAAGGSTSVGLVPPLVGGSAAATGGAAPGTGASTGTGGRPGEPNTGQGGSAPMGASGARALTAGQAGDPLPDIATDDAGCSCSIPNRRRSGGGALQALALFAVAFIGWRTRRLRGKPRTL